MFRRNEPWFEKKYALLSAWSDLIHPFRLVYYGLGNWFSYARLLWQDRDWDYSNLLLLWEKKFRRMAWHHEKYGGHVGHLDVARDLRVCADLCKRIRQDEYDEEAQKAMNEKWGKLSTWFEKTDNSRLSRMVFSRPKAVTVEEKEQERQDARRMYDQAEKQRHTDLEYLCTMVSKNLFTWWD